MSFFKHVGTANGKKVIIVQRSLPNEEHMAAVIYSDILPSKYHDDIMSVLESAEGQAAYEFRDILQRRMSSSGNNLMEAIGNEGYLKRVSTNAVIVKPNSKSSIRLDELNTLLNSVGRGEQAVKRLEAMESQQGLADPSKLAHDESTIYPDQIDAGAYAPPVASPAIAAAPAPSAPAVDMQTQMMMEMMKTLQNINSQLQEMNQAAPVAKPKKPRTTKAVTG